MLHRAQMTVMLDNVLSSASRAQQQKAKGQLSFFDGDSGFKDAAANEIPQIKEWPEPQLLAFEKEMLGFYVSGHPLARYANQLRRFSKNSMSELSQHKDGDLVSVSGLISKVKQLLTRAKQEKMAIIKLEDLQGEIEVLIFPSAYKQVHKDILLSSVVLVRGRINLREESPKIVANDIIPMDYIYKYITGININLTGLRENLFSSLKEKLSSSPGKIPIYLHLDSPSKSRIQLVVGDELYVEPTEDLIRDIEELLGEDRVSVTISQ
jgi:DNA polymerase-3 subunit alpha